MARPTEFETAFANVSALLDLAQYHALESMGGAHGGESYEVTRREGDQLMALLIVIDDYAKRVLAEHEENRGNPTCGAPRDRPARDGELPERGE